MSKPVVALIGEDGSIINLLALAGRKLDKESKEEMVSRAFKAKSYDDALNIIQEYVEIV